MDLDDETSFSSSSCGLSSWFGEETLLLQLAGSAFATIALFSMVCVPAEGDGERGSLLTEWSGSLGDDIEKVK